MPKPYETHEALAAHGEAFKELEDLAREVWDDLSQFCDSKSPKDSARPFLCRDERVTHTDCTFRNCPLFHS